MCFELPACTYLTGCIQMYGIKHPMERSYATGNYMKELNTFRGHFKVKQEVSYLWDEVGLNTLALI